MVHGFYNDLFHSMISDREPSEAFQISGVQQACVDVNSDAFYPLPEPGPCLISMLRALTWSPASGHCLNVHVAMRTHTPRCKWEADLVNTSRSAVAGLSHVRSQHAQTHTKAALRMCRLLSGCRSVVWLCWL